MKLFDLGESSALLEPPPDCFGMYHQFQQDELDEALRAVPKLEASVITSERTKSETHIFGLRSAREATAA